MYRRIKLPFEHLGGFIVWYIAPDFPLAILKSDLLQFIDDAPFDTPMQSVRLKMAVFKGIGDMKEIANSSVIVTKEIEHRLGNNDWPYSYKFFEKEAIAAFEAYTSTFCFINTNIRAEENRTSVDNHVSYIFTQRKLFKKIDLVSFSKDMVVSVIGPSVEYFVGLSNGDYIYFGRGLIKQLFIDEVGPISEKPGYRDNDCIL